MADPVSPTDLMKRKRVRSPNYPALALKEAIEKAKQLYDEIHHHPAPVEVINQTWGYKPDGSTGPLYLAALRRYGLVEETEGTDAKQFKITDSARKIFLSPPDEDIARPLIKEAALKPKIFRELWTQYHGEIPSDPMLRYHLATEKNFNKDAVDNFIRIFRDTIAFAKLIPGDEPQGGDTWSADVSGDECERGVQDEISSTQTLVESRANVTAAPPIHRPLGARQVVGGEIVINRTVPPNQKEFTLPVPNGGILIRGPFPLSESDFETFKKAIELFKPWLVKTASSSGQVQSEPEE